MARRLADTARFHKEPDVALWFEQIAADGEARAEHLDEMTARFDRAVAQRTARHTVRPGEPGNEAS